MKALIIVDIQNDFLPGGALAVPRGDEIVAVINRLAAEYPLVVATQDFHPADHKSFATNHPGRDLYEVVDLNGLSQVLWPVHCVQGSEGAELALALRRDLIHEVVPKGQNPEIDSYSGFFDNGRRQATGLDGLLRARGVEEVFVCGLAADYCVKFTALDAVSLGYRTFLIEDATRGVDLHPGDTELAFDELRAAGVKLVSAAEMVPV